MRMNGEVSSEVRLIVKTRLGCGGLAIYSEATEGLDI